MKKLSKLCKSIPKLSQFSDCIKRRLNTYIIDIPTECTLKERASSSLYRFRTIGSKETEYRIHCIRVHREIYEECPDISYKVESIMKLSYQDYYHWPLNYYRDYDTRLGKPDWLVHL